MGIVQEKLIQGNIRAPNPWTPLVTDLLILGRNICCAHRVWFTHIYQINPEASSLWENSFFYLLRVIWTGHRSKAFRETDLIQAILTFVFLIIMDRHLPSARTNSLALYCLVSFHRYNMRSNQTILSSVQNPTDILVTITRNLIWKGWLDPDSETRVTRTAELLWVLGNIETSMEITWKRILIGESCRARIVEFRCKR